MDFVKSIGSSVVQKLDSFQGTELEKKVKDATSNENWGTSSTTKNEIADATHDYEGFKAIMGILWKRLAEKDNNWRVVFKSLDLLMFLVKCGHDRVVNDVRDHQYTLRNLQNFSYIDPTNGQDRGRGIRQLAQQIVELIEDKKRLNEAREEALKQRRKLQDVGKTSFNNENYSGYGYNSNYSSNNFKSRSNDDFRSSNQDNEEDSTDKKKKRKSKSKSKNKDEDEFDAWTDEEREANKKKKKKKGSDEEDASDEDKEKKKRKKKVKKDTDEEETTEANTENEDDDESAKKKQKKKVSQKEKKPFQGMKLEPPSTDKTTTTKSSDFGFDDMTNAFVSTNIGGDFDDFSSFDAPQPKKTSQVQSNKDISFDDFTFDNQKTSKPSGNNGISWDNKQSNNVQSGDLLDSLNNTSGNGVDDLFGTFQSNDTGGINLGNFTEEKEVTIKKTLSGAIKEEKTTTKKSSVEQTKTKPTSNSNDAWGLGGNLINLDNLSKTTTTYAAFNPDSTKKPQTTTSTGTGIPPLTTYGTSRPQFTSLGGSLDTMGMGVNPQMGMGMNPQMGMGMNPQMGMGFNPQMGMGFNPQMNMGMNPQMGMGFNPQMGMGFNPGQNPNTGTNFNQGFGNPNQPSMW